MRKTIRMKHKAVRARSRLDELTFRMFNVRTEAVNGVNGIGHIDTLLRPVLQRFLTLFELQETKRAEFRNRGILVPSLFQL